MRKAMERQQQQAQSDARAVLSDLATDHETEEAANGTSGRRRFGAGVAKSASAAREMEDEMEEDDSASDEEEDASAKAERLGRRLAGQAPVASSSGRPAAAQKIVTVSTLPNFDNGFEAFTGGAIGASTSEGRLAVAMPPAGPSQSSALEALAKQRASISGQDDLFRRAEPAGDPPRESTAPAANGSVAVTVGPSRGKPAGAAPQQAAAFIPAKKFTGAKPGYVFKKGPEGVGYYVDAPVGRANGRPNDSSSTKHSKKSKAQQNGAAQADGRPGSAAAGDVAGSDSDEEGGGRHMRLAGSEADVQHQLVRRAFAGDDVEADFAAEKAAHVTEELPEVEEPSVMPGWGMWAGQQREPRWMVQAKAKAQK